MNFTPRSSKLLRTRKCGAATVADLCSCALDVVELTRGVRQDQRLRKRSLNTTQEYEKSGYVKNLSLTEVLLADFRR
jgi:hypothetical protein